jgi:hypothetical protein
MWLTRYDTKIYLSIKRSDTIDHFLLPRNSGKEYLDIQKIDGEWVVKNPIQEYRRRVTAKLQQEVLKDQALQEFEQYANTIWDMLTGDIATANGAGSIAYWVSNPRQVKEILSDKSGWLKACCELKQVRYQSFSYGHDYIKKTFNPTKIRRTLYKVHKDKFNTAEVPIGTTCCRHWLDK